MVKHLFVYLRVVAEYLRLVIVHRRVGGETFIRAVYRVCLGREPEEPRKGQLLDALRNRSRRRSDILVEVRDSPEALARRHERRLWRRVTLTLAAAYCRRAGRERYRGRLHQLFGVLSDAGGITPFEVLGQSTDVIKPLPSYGFAIALNAADRVIGRQLLEGGLHEGEVISVLLPYLRRDTRFLDVGANIGFYSLLAASRCPEGKVFSFEPDQRNFQLFQTSIAYNGYNALIAAYPFAVSDEEAVITVSDLGNAMNSGARFTAKDEGVLRSKVHGPSPQFRHVRAVALDTFLDDARIDVMKIDIEGHEPFALKGMAGLLKRNRPVIFAELAPSNLRDLANVTPEAFLAFFTDLGYELHVIAGAGPVGYGRDIAKLMDYFRRAEAHHLDILALPGAG